LKGLAANSRDPESWALGTEAYSIDPYAARRRGVQGGRRPDARRLFQERRDHRNL
jgi:hypothetical protein